LTHFIDFHVHPPVDALVGGPLAAFEIDLPVLDDAAVAAHFESRDGRAVILGLDTESRTRHGAFSNRDVATMVEAYPEVFVGMGSVDPARGAGAVAGIHEAGRLGLAGLAFDPVVQRFDPSERAMRHLWDTASDHGHIVLFRTGVTRLGRDMPGGAGLRLAHGDPRLVDIVASVYPEMQIIVAHFGSLWREEAIAVAAHKQNVWLTLVGAPASTYAELFEENTLGPERCLFGSDWAFADLDAQLKGWNEVDDDVGRRVLHDNAVRLLGRD
jgi:uncharacterized protein